MNRIYKTFYLFFYCLFLAVPINAYFSNNYSHLFNKFELVQNTHLSKDNLIVLDSSNLVFALDDDADDDRTELIKKDYLYAIFCKRKCIPIAKSKFIYYCDFSLKKPSVKIYIFTSVFRI
jgi:hypothetical protein